MVTLGSSIDAIFEALQDWRTIGATVVIVTFLCGEIILLWIMVTSMVREVGPSILEQIGLLPMSSRRVYRYLLAVHDASEPVTTIRRDVPGVLKLISVFFMPVGEILAKVRARFMAGSAAGA
ncbi:Uncharacterized protein AC496_2028 [Pseudomonas savastanoi pv. glycinea]|nr:Uncharacterized protein AC497_2304 [Pseudomonas savastanoi pv. glycinea]KPC32461.1 Uncharacterized protein AC498_4078 [Pseudomonas savastanoi pv. glycinea]KPC38499.1 Uncharacterized protein ABK00_3567 [Pseudomonas savastanoi pv. glycinea]KPC45088.1 Uncharacterized protein AC496_2028 [Pseudomonas savastanoi pv. glycinea]